MKNKNILEVCLSPDLGGLELYMSNCSKYLSKEFNVYNAISKNSKLENYFKNEKNIFILKRKSSFSLYLALKLAKIIDKQSIDIIHLHWTKDIPIVVFSKKLSKRKPKIVQTRHMTMTRFKNDFYHKFLYKNIDIIICVTKALQEQVNKFIPKDIRPRTKLLYLGANESKALNDEQITEFKKELKVENSFMLGLIGRINEFKGQHLLIEAMNLLKEKELDIKAYIIGHAMSEEYLEKLKQKVIKYELEEQVLFVGFTNEPSKFMQACDVVLMTSRNETFGLVTIEAMRNGTAVIASNSGGVLEIIDDEQTGLLFESGNFEDLTLKIEMLYKDDILREKLACFGQKKAEKQFDNEKQFKKLINFFKEV
ncbi:glycosyltransferase involved in cell wall biosynthesis [Malaciobacter marinus]|uniref:Glycosyltransferase involved in cell wall biosynthesis n=1 Tax=Malaciobacter marinus TaxID=505249 RepID=A0AB36ZUG6_9BACT|nr:glycosyltransferase family 4 protein [Malaciobacter marinus]PPK60184.1 glycosyltransferase involved in cell wall biosynthesis [Malaciobacter marinus]